MVEDSWWLTYQNEEYESVSSFDIDEDLVLSSEDDERKTSPKGETGSCLTCGRTGRLDDNCGSCPGKYATMRSSRVIDVRKMRKIHPKVQKAVRALSQPRGQCETCLHYGRLATRCGYCRRDENFYRKITGEAVSRATAHRLNRDPLLG